jgi:hypothetical protein
MGSPGMLSPGKRCSGAGPSTGLARTGTGPALEPQAFDATCQVPRSWLCASAVAWMLAW